MHIQPCSPSAITPWQVPQFEQQHTSNNKLQTPSKKLIISYSPKSSKTTSKDKFRRTTAKIATINLCNTNQTTPVVKKQIYRSLTPNVNKKPLSQRKMRKQSPQIVRRGSLMTLESWREESNRLLLKIAKNQQYGKQKKPRPKLFEEKHPKKQQQFKLISICLGQKDTGTLSLQQNPKMDSFNTTRFKLLQTQKKFKY